MKKMEGTKKKGKFVALDVLPKFLFQQAGSLSWQRKMS